MATTRWDPWQEFANLRQTMDQVIENGVGGVGRFVRGDETAGRGLALDVIDGPDRYTIHAAIPGLKPDDIDISIDESVLTIRGTYRQDDEAGDGESYIRRELRLGSFERSFTLPRSVDADRAEARFEHGMLTLTLPKRVEGQARKIKVTVASAGG